MKSCQKCLSHNNRSVLDNSLKTSDKTILGPSNILILSKDQLKRMKLLRRPLLNFKNVLVGPGRVEYIRYIKYAAHFFILSRLSLKVDNTGQLLHNCRVTIVVIVIDDLVVIDDSRKLATP